MKKSRPWWETPIGWMLSMAIVFALSVIVKAMVDGDALSTRSLILWILGGTPVAALFGLLGYWWWPGGPV